jgi:hypothetical protein
MLHGRASARPEAIKEDVLAAIEAEGDEED